MKNNRSPLTKFAISKMYKASAALQDPMARLFFSKDADSVPIQASNDFLKITSISPVKQGSNENISLLKKSHQLKAHMVKSIQTSDSNYDVDVLDLLELYRTKENASEGKLDQQKSESQKKGLIQTKVTVLRERMVKKEQDKEKEQEEILKHARQQYSDKERDPLVNSLTKSTVQAQQPQQIQQPERDRDEILKIIKSQQREQISDSERKKILLYFRYRLAYLTKLTEDKIRSVSDNKTNKSGRLKVSNMANGNLPSLASSNNSKNQAPTVYVEETNIMDEVWRYLKLIASTKTKYKYRDVVGFNKKVREAIKTLVPVTKDSNGKSGLTRLDLGDEDLSGKVKKKSKSPKPEKLQACTEFAAKRKDNPAAKVFIVSGGYPALRQALEERGWLENPSHSSKDFILKWCLKIDLSFEGLKPSQYVNHFENNTAITTKQGLARSVRSLIWTAGDDIDTFYPRCYDLNDGGEFDDFIEDFKFEKAVAMLKLSKLKRNQSSRSESSLFRVKLSIALHVCERRLKSFDMIIYELIKEEGPLFTQEEWELLNAQDLQILDGGKYERLMRTLRRKYGIEFDDSTSPDVDKTLNIQAEATLLRLEAIFPQISMNQGKNAWIVKPAGLSRGRGIYCHHSLPDILDHIQIRETEWVAQKYIENPLIIKNRKFDIRQWVLVTDWAPLTVWFYGECYIRFTAHDFNPEDLANKFAHLTNNAIGKHAENFETSEIEGNMWTSEEFDKYIQESTGKDLYNELIKPQMKNIVMKSLQSTQDMLDSRKGCFELYGYDFMIDEDHKTWLIEINSSPSMDYSTSITERMVKMCLEDCVKVVVDYGMCKGKNKKTVDTGLFECITGRKEV